MVINLAKIVGIIVMLQSILDARSSEHGLTTQAALAAFRFLDQPKKATVAYRTFCMVSSRLAASFIAVRNWVTSCPVL